MKRLGAVMILGLGFGAMLAILTAGCFRLVNSDPKPLPTIDPAHPLPTPKPTPEPLACPTPDDDDARTATTPQVDTYASDFGSAILAIQRAHPDWFTNPSTDPQGRPTWKVPSVGDQKHYPTAPAIQARREEFFGLLAAEFAKSRLCAFLRGDELHVYDPRVAPIVYTRYKPFEYGGGASIVPPYMGSTPAVVQ